jgi:hypothetical protein
VRAARRIALVGLVAAMPALATAIPAFAEEAYGGRDSGAITAGANDGGATSSGQQTSGGSSGGGGGTRPTCTAANGSVGAVSYRRVPDSDLLAFQQEQVRAEGGGAWYWEYCGGEPARYVMSFDNGAVYIPAGSPGGPPANPADLAADALQRTPLPTPTIAITPPPDKVIVNANVWLSIDPSQWGQRTASASAGAVTSTVIAEPERVVWDMGDGQQVTCTGPGTPYDPNQDYFSQQPDCGYIYRRSSAGYPNDAATVTATVHYHVIWSASGAPGGGDLGTVSRTSAPIIVRVNEIQSIVTGARP